MKPRIPGHPRQRSFFWAQNAVTRSTHSVSDVFGTARRLSMLYGTAYFLPSFSSSSLRHAINEVSGTGNRCAGSLGWDVLKFFHIGRYSFTCNKETSTPPEIDYQCDPHVPYAMYTMPLCPHSCIPFFSFLHNPDQHHHQHQFKLKSVDQTHILSTITSIFLIPRSPQSGTLLFAWLRSQTLFARSSFRL